MAGCSCTPNCLVGTGQAVQGRQLQQQFVFLQVPVASGSKTRKNSSDKQKKNESERERVKHIREDYLKLRAVLGRSSKDAKLCKLAVLHGAIEYITALSAELERLKGNSNIQLPPPPQPAAEAELNISSSDESIIEVTRYLYCAL